MPDPDDASPSIGPPLTDEGSDTTGSDVVPRFWVLSPSRRAVHWGILGLAVVVIALSVTTLLVLGHPSVLVFFVLVPGWFSWRQLRAVTAVWYDPQQDTLTFFRAAGGALRTRPDRVRRIDRGPFTDYISASQSERAPARIVADDGVATLSRFFEYPDEIVDGLTLLNPAIRVEL